MFWRGVVVGGCLVIAGCRGDFDASDADAGSEDAESDTSPGDGDGDVDCEGATLVRVGETEAGELFEDELTGEAHTSWFLQPNDGAAASLSMYVQDAPAGAKGRMALYENQLPDGLPKLLLATSGEQELAVGWNEFPLDDAVALEAGEAYWVAFMVDGGEVSVSLTSAAAGSTVRGSNAWGAFLPDFNAEDVLPNRWSVQLAYCEAG